MAIQLVIQDGHPYWYLSPDIWVVPGSDPTGAPGSPVAGQPAYLWSRVSNTGSTDATGVRVDFYWANPALQVTRTTATLLGSAFVDVVAGGSQEALCLVPWLPVIVNSGHECLIAVAHHPGTPLPTPLPDAFDPPTYPQVAQKNLTVLVAGANTMMLTLTVAGLQRLDKTVLVTAESGGELDKHTLTSLGLVGWTPARDAAVEVGLNFTRPCVDDTQPLGEVKLELRVPRGTSLPLHAAIRVKTLNRGEYQLIRIVEQLDGHIVGGLGLVVVAEHNPHQEVQS